MQETPRKRSAVDQDVICSKIKSNDKHVRCTQKNIVVPCSQHAMHAKTNGRAVLNYIIISRIRETNQN